MCKTKHSIFSHYFSARFFLKCIMPPMCEVNELFVSCVKYYFLIDEEFPALLIVNVSWWFSKVLCYCLCTNNFPWRNTAAVSFYVLFFHIVVWNNPIASIWMFAACPSFSFICKEYGILFIIRIWWSLLLIII